MWELDCKETWAPKNCCFWTMVLEKIKSPLDYKEIKPVHPKGNQSWIFIGRTDAKAEAPTLWPSDAKNWLSGKDPDAGEDWRQEEKGVTEDEMVGWHHWLNGHEFEQAPGVCNGQRSLACCTPCGGKEWDMTELRVILISASVLFFSVCLLFISSRSLLIDSSIFSILFLRFWIIFTIIFSEFLFR